MNKEPIGLYIFRFVLGLGMFAFMAMLYWSSVSVEESLKDLRHDVAQLKNDIFSLHLETVRSSHLNSESGSYSENSDVKSKNTAKVAQNGKHIDPSLPNLLEDDEFYIATLPKLLGKNFKPQGTFESATIGRPNNLHPFNNFSEIAGWYSLCTASVASMDIGKYESFSPGMAIKMEARKHPNSSVVEYWVHLRDDLYWQPLQQRFFGNTLTLAPEFLRKHKVTAHDFAFYFDAVMNPHIEEQGAIAARGEYEAIEEIKVIDDLTFVVRWKPFKVTLEDGSVVEKIPYRSKLFTGGLQPLPEFVFKYFADGKKILDDDSAADSYRTSKVWAQNFSDHWSKNVIVSCGPWMFDGMTEQAITFRRNNDFYNKYAALAQGITVRFKETTDATWQAFKTNQLDSYSLPPNQLLEWQGFVNSNQYQEQKSKGLGIEELNYVARVYYYVGWNQANPLFSSKKVRQALTMSIDRQRIVEQNLNGLGIEISCPFYLFSSSCDASIEPWPFDLDKAKRLLEEEGWIDTDGDGVIDKEINGKRVPFKFALTYYVKNSVTKSLCEYIATALKKVGISCSLNGVDMADLSSSFQDKTFDALSMGWALSTPPEDPRQLWSSSGAKEKGSSNAVGFANAEADAIIDQLQYEDDEEKRIKLYHRFHAIIHDEQPYTFLYSPKTTFLYREYLKGVFIPKERQDLIPGANSAEPNSRIFWLKHGMTP